MEKTDKLRYFKVVLCAALMVGASVGLCFYASGVFYQPLATGLGISLGEASMTTMFMLIFMALTTLLVPGLIRKFQLHHLLLAGTALCAGSVILSSFCSGRFWIYLLASLEGCGAALIGPVPATTQINYWFERRKYWATAVVLAGSALCAALLSPLMAAVIAAYGWRMGYVIQAILIVMLMVPTLLWQMPLHPAAAGTEAYGAQEAAPAPARRQKNTVLGSFALMAVLSACLLALPMHYSTLTTSMGQSAILGAQMLSWAMIGNLFFKLAGGWLSDRIKAVLASGVLDLLALVGTIGILICVQTTSPAALRAMAFFFGSAYALTELSLPLFVSNRFAPRRYVRVYAVLNFLSNLTTALAIPAVGFLYDGLKSYVWIYVIAIALEVVIGLVIWYLIHDQSADDLVTSPATRGFIERIREWSARRKAEHEARVAQRQAREEAEKEAQAAAQPAVSAYETSVSASTPAASVSAEPAVVEEREAAKADEQPAVETADETHMDRTGMTEPAQSAPVQSAPEKDETPESAKPASGVSVTVSPVKEDTDPAMRFDMKQSDPKPSEE